MSIVARVLHVALVGLMGGTGVQVAAQGPLRPPGVAPGETATSLSGCAGSGSLELNIRDDTAMLDDTDRAALGAAMLQRYPVLGRDGFVPAATLGRDYYVYDEVRHALIGERTGETFQMGDIVKVKLVEAAPVKGGLKFEIVGEGRKGERPKIRGKSRKPQRGRR